MYYSYVVLTSLAIYCLWHKIIVGRYVSKNHHRSLAFAQQREVEWEKNKPDEEDEWDDEDEDDDEDEGDDE